MIPVLNATPLIYLGKKRKLELLKHLFTQSLTAKEVEVEVYKRERSPEALEVRNATREGWLIVEPAPESQKHDIEKRFPEMDEGEAATLALALKQREPMVIVDDAEARAAADYFQLETHGTLYLLLEAYKQGLLPSKKTLIISPQHDSSRVLSFHRRVCHIPLALRGPRINCTSLSQRIPQRTRPRSGKGEEILCATQRAGGSLVSTTSEFGRLNAEEKEIRGTLMQNRGWCSKAPLKIAGFYI